MERLSGDQIINNKQARQQLEGETARKAKKELEITVDFIAGNATCFKW